MAQRASVAPTPLARRGAGRACAHGRRRGDRRHHHQAREGARCRPDRRAGAVRHSSPTTTPGASTREPRTPARPCFAECSPMRIPHSRSRRASRRTPPRSRKPTGHLDLDAARERARRPRPSAVSAHRRARRASRTGRDDLARRRRRRRLVRAARGSARRESSHDVRGMAARSAAVSPARAVAYDVLLRVFDGDAYADRAFRTAAAQLDERDRALAQRLTFGAVQRVRTLDHAIETLGRRPVATPRRARPGGAPSRCVPARVRRRCRALRRRQRVGRARPSRRTRASGLVHERRAPARRRRASRHCSTRCPRRRRSKRG